MNPLAFRQWVSCVTVVAMLFGTAAPLGICYCEGCLCERNISRLLPDFGGETKDCCCTPSEPQPQQSDEKCCGSPETPCQCSCGDVQTEDAILPKAVLPVKMPNVGLLWNIVLALPNLADAADTLSRFGHWNLPPPHVPLHVLLCVFLN